jgi:hypothetical protein
MSKVFEKELRNKMVILRRCGIRGLHVRYRVRVDSRYRSVVSPSRLELKRGKRDTLL